MGSLDMLRSRSDFEALQAGSKSRAHPLLVVRYRRNNLERTRYGISTGRRLGPAVVRNRVRRRLRSVLRAFDPRVAPGWDVLIVARPAAASARQADLGVALEDLLRRAGVTARSVSA
jgi:ribonuclease P protein component